MNAQEVMALLYMEKRQQQVRGAGESAALPAACNI